MSACAVGYALAVHRRCVRSLHEALVDDDELERRLGARQTQLEHVLARRQSLTAGRASLFTGTGCGVWALTGGSAHYLEAALAFCAGLVGWMASGEVYRRIGSPADLAAKLRGRAARRLQGVDQDSGTG
jgi:hypothetical protein